MPRRLVLFDFDGTLTTKDTLMVFIRYYAGLPKMILGFLVLSPVLIAYKLRLMNNQTAKELVMKFFFGKSLHAEFQESCDAFARTIIPGLIREKALETIHHYKEDNAEIAVVSASPENWVAPWCKEQSIVCLSTRMQIADSRITGMIDGNNCYGSEKVRRIKEVFDLSAYDEIIAYGDTSGDREMLAVAHHGNYKPFR